MSLKGWEGNCPYVFLVCAQECGSRGIEIGGVEGVLNRKCERCMRHVSAVFDTSVHSMRGLESTVVYDETGSSEVVRYVQFWSRSVLLGVYVGSWPIVDVTVRSAPQPHQARNSTLKR